MGKFVIKAVLLTAIAAIAFIIIGRFLIIRTVNYQIAGLQIPSRYNILTGTVKPIIDYKGKHKLQTMEAGESKNIGLSDEQVVIAKLRWAIFEQWVAGRPEYKDWGTNPETFKKANDAFKAELEKHGPNIKVVE